MVVLLVNGKFCKDPTLATAEDFYFTVLNQRKETNNPFGFNVTFGNVDNVPGLNTLGLSFARADVGVNGQVPPHYHPRASEILGVSEGTLLAGFVSDQRLFTKTLNVGDVFVFPQGVIHFVVNIGEVPAVAFASLNSQNPGTIFIADTVFGSNPSINPKFLAKAFQLDSTIIMKPRTIFV
ncbi:unnamed protein product [Microthlaspi erraticum]|uniref:Germin-like protein n=1 Tax=Microthlaspi erraticum TaxID=1685480 RepID=A0A6D2KT47_9BRAS|nr:unnamed protein product [Microthlaspi erraticum]